MTFEVNTDDVTEMKLKDWKQVGINRLSIGLQSFDDEELKLARLALLSATKQVIANGLNVLGVSAPEKM